jgi:pseudouridine synthase
VELGKILEVIDLESTIDPTSEAGGTLPAVSGELVLRDVSFAYPARRDHSVYKGLNLCIEAGTTVALVGPSGCGKSTCVQLIERFYDPDAGSVLLDGVDIKTLNVRWLRQNIGLVSQEPVLFTGSISDNIKNGKDSATQADVEAAAKMANADSFIRSFPDGYNTQVGEKGIQLSGGQKQRIAIARAIVRDPKILILDEATSALDTASERVVQEALDRLLQMKKRTTIIIAHRLSTIREADRIVVDGKPIQLPCSLIYIALNKPRGVHSTMTDEKGRPCVGDYLKGRRERLFHVGRLDADTEGLLILTNDGDLAQRLAHPSFGVDKTYLAQVKGTIERDMGKRLREGIELDDGFVRVDGFKIVTSAPGRALVEVVLHEGRKHIVRRLLAAAGHPVEGLVRVKVGPIGLGDLRPGKVRTLSIHEVGELYAAVGL